MPARTSRRYSASPVRLRSGLAVAIASTEWVCSCWITPFQLADSANAPWTRTTVGRVVDMADLLRVRGCRASSAARGSTARGQWWQLGSYVVERRCDVLVQPRGAYWPTTRKK